MVWQTFWWHINIMLVYPFPYFIVFFSVLIIGNKHVQKIILLPYLPWFSRHFFPSRYSVSGNKYTSRPSTRVSHSICTESNFPYDRTTYFVFLCLLTGLRFLQLFMNPVSCSHKLHSHIRFSPLILILVVWRLVNINP